MTVIVYTAPNCQPCRATKRWLVDNRVPFEERNAADHIEELRAGGYREAPVVIAGSEGWGGFRPDLLQRLSQ